MTIFLARFVPIVRTFAPFIAGIGEMSYARFAMWNVTGGFVWVFALVLAGYWFGRIPIVRDNFETVILGDRRHLDPPAASSSGCARGAPRLAWTPLLDAPGGPPDTSRMSDRVQVTMADGVADVRLSRPEKLNALDPAMFEALVETGGSLATDPSLRAVVLSGEGRAFCAGLDFASFMATGLRRRRPAAARTRGPASAVNFAQRAAWVWSEVPVPVIAAVHGVAFGGGLQIALAADMRLRRAGRAAVGDGDPLGPHPRHDGHPDAAPPGAARRRQGADLHRPRRLGPRGRRARPRARASRTIRTPPPSRWRARSRASRRAPSARRSAC